MIALDANTALRLYRDVQYDIRELLEGLKDLEESQLSVHFFKFADGKVLPVPPAEFVCALTAAFESVVLDGTMTLAPEAGRLSVTLAQGGAVGLQAVLSGASLQQVGEGPLAVTSSHIKKLVVRGLLRVADAQRALEGKTLQSLRVSNAAVADFSYDQVQVRSLDADGPAASRYVGNLQVGSQWVDGGLTVSPAAVPMVMTREPTKRWFGVNDTTDGLPAAVIQANQNVGLQRVALSGVTGYMKFEYSVPVAAKSAPGELPRIGQYPVASSSAGIVTSLATPNVPPPPAGLNDLALWPYWSLTGSWEQGQLTESYDTRSYVNTWAIEVPPLSQRGVFPYVVVRVRNNTTSPIKKVANAWAFSAVEGKGRVSVLSRVTLPPMSEVEFLFSYNATVNMGFMFPTRVLNG